MYCVYVPIKKPEILKKNEERLSLECFQTTIKSSKSSLYFLHDGADGQLKCIKNKTGQMITINTSRRDQYRAFNIKKKSTIILIFDENKGWNYIYGS